jgi:hypothetical protein
MNNDDVLQDQTDYHKARICMICNEFITGMENHEWSKATILENSHCFKAENHSGADADTLPECLKQYYQVQDTDLQGLLLSPRYQLQNGTHYMICIPCNKGFQKKSRIFRIPKCNIANGFAISEILQNVQQIVKEVMSPLVAIVGPFCYVSNVCSGQHKSIVWQYVFL